MPDLRRCVAVAVLVGLTGASPWAGEGPPTPNPATPRDALREIVQNACLVHWRTEHRPDPCVRVELPTAGGIAAGYAVLKDRKGGAHFLLIPTRTVSGIESADLLATGSPNDFDAAWSARAELEPIAGRPLERSEIGLAVNSAHARSQDQLHIHIECLQPLMRDVLRRSAAGLDTLEWLPVEVPGWRLVALRVDGAVLASANPFQLLANRLPGALQSMGDYSLLVAGVTLPAGPGFVILAGTGPGTERLLDPDCTPG